MGFPDVTFLPTPTRIYTMFFTNRGRGEGLGTTKCLRTVVGGKQGHAPCRILSSQQSLFLCQLNFMVIITLSES